MNTERLKGIFLPICTPFKDGETFDEEAYAANMTIYADTRVAGYLVLGSNGENRSLSFEEQVRAAQIAYRHKAPRQAVMLGALYEAEKLVMEFIHAVGAENMDFVTLLPPSYFRSQMTDEALYGFFSRLADAAPVPVMLYNAPKFTGTTLSTELAERLSAHGNIAGIKDSGKGDIERFFHLNGDKFAVLSGSINTLLKTLKGGCPGGICSLGNAFPNEVCKIYELFTAGLAEEAEAQTQRLQEASKAVSGDYGVAGVKLAMDWAGLKGGLPRRPLMPVPDAQARASRARLTELGLLQ